MQLYHCPMTHYCKWGEMMPRHWNVLQRRVDMSVREFQQYVRWFFDGVWLMLILSILVKPLTEGQGRTLFGYGQGEGKDALRQAVRELLVCPMLHLPNVSKAADVLLIQITGGTGMGMAALQQVSTEIREEFNAGEHVVFGAHVDENMGDRVQITVLGATDLEAGTKVVDVAPIASDVISAIPKSKVAHPSKLKEKQRESKSNLSK